MPHAAFTLPSDAFCRLPVLARRIDVTGMPLMITQTAQQQEFPYGNANWRVDVLVLGAPQAALRVAARLAHIMGEDPNEVRMQPLSDPNHGIEEGVWLPPQFFERPEAFSSNPPSCSGCEFEPYWQSTPPDVGEWVAKVLEHDEDVAVSIVMRWGPRNGEVKGSTTVVEERWVWPPYRAHQPASPRLVRSTWAVFGLTDLMAATLAPNGEVFDEDGWKQMWHLDNIKGFFPLEEVPPEDMVPFQSWCRAQRLQSALPLFDDVEEAGVRL